LLKEESPDSGVKNWETSWDVSSRKGPQKLVSFTGEKHHAIGNPFLEQVVYARINKTESGLYSKLRVICVTFNYFELFCWRCLKV